MVKGSNGKLSRVLRHKEPAGSLLKIAVLALICLTLGELVEIQYQEVPMGGYIEQLAIIVIDNGLNQPYRILCPNCTASADVYDENRVIQWQNQPMTQPITPGRFALTADQRFETGKKYIMIANVTSPDYGSELVESVFVVGEQTAAIAAADGCKPAESFTDTWSYIKYVVTPDGFKCTIMKGFLDSLLNAPVFGDLIKSMLAFFQRDDENSLVDAVTSFIQAIFTDDDSLFKNPTAFLTQKLVPWLAEMLWGVFLIAAPGIMVLECIILLYAFVTNPDTMKALYETLRINIIIIQYTAETSLNIVTGAITAVLGVI